MVCSTLITSSKLGGELTSVDVVSVFTQDSSVELRQKSFTVFQTKFPLDLFYYYIIYNFQYRQ